MESEHACDPRSDFGPKGISPDRTALSCRLPCRGDAGHPGFAVQAARLAVVCSDARADGLIRASDSVVTAMGPPSGVLAATVMAVDVAAAVRMIAPVRAVNAMMRPRRALMMVMMVMMVHRRCHDDADHLAALRSGGRGEGKSSEKEGAG